MTNLRALSGAGETPPGARQVIVIGERDQEQQDQSDDQKNWRRVGQRSFPQRLK
jgi:hypothetical protein